MFKKLFSMVRQEYAPLTDDEIAYVNSNPAEHMKEDHDKALAGGRTACYRLAFEYGYSDPLRGYLWATVALLAGSPNALELMRILDHTVPRDQRFYIETIARKWYNLHKDNFAATKAAYLKMSKRLAQWEVHLPIPRVGDGTA